MASSKLRGALNLQQRLFVAEYLVDLNGKQAAIRAGYAAASAEVQASRLLSLDKVKVAVEAKRALLVKRVDVTAERVIAELAKLGFANMNSYMRVGPNGDPFLDFSHLTADETAALAEVTVDDYVDGRGEDARQVKRVKFKLADKRAALVDLGRHLKLFVDRSEVAGANGEPLIPPVIGISFTQGGPGNGDGGGQPGHDPEGGESGPSS